MSDIRECVVCKTKYKYCMGCPHKYNTKETWRNIFCSENCREIYQIYNSLKGKEIDKSTAKKRLKKCDLSRLSLFNDFIKNDITQIVNEGNTSKRKRISE